MVRIVARSSSKSVLYLVAGYTVMLGGMLALAPM